MASGRVHTEVNSWNFREVNGMPEGAVRRLFSALGSAC